MCWAAACCLDFDAGAAVLVVGLFVSCCCGIGRSVVVDAAS